jgi:hypothetical protein
MNLFELFLQILKEFHETLGEEANNQKERVEHLIASLSTKKTSNGSI